MKQEDIQQALSRLEKLYRQGHIAKELFTTKKNQLLARLDGNPAHMVSRAADAAQHAIQSTQHPKHPSRPPHPDALENERHFSPPPHHLLTRAPSPVAPAERPIALSADGLEQLVDKQTAAEIRAITYKKPSKATEPPKRDMSNHLHQRSKSERAKRRTREVEKMARISGMHNIIDKNVPKEGDLLRERFRLIELLGSGGMGQVFLVEDIRFGGNYAAKVLHPWVVQHEPTINRFVQEFKMIERLKHPGIVRTYMLDEEPKLGYLFYLMEYIHGKTLQDVLEKAVEKNQGPPFSGEETLHFLEKLSEILEYMHKQRVLHRDLKPTNIMLFQDESGYSLKLLDFGLAKWMTENNEPALHTGHAGTFFYIAPEQLMGGSAALVAADVFSLGVILYQMLTGALPVAMAVPPSEINQELPPYIDKVLRKAMNAHWQQRHQSVKELLHDFRSAFSRQDVASYSRTKDETHSSVSNEAGSSIPSEASPPLFRDEVSSDPSKATEKRDSVEHELFLAEQMNKDIQQALNSTSPSPVHPPVHPPVPTPTPARAPSNTPTAPERMHSFARSRSFAEPRREPRKRDAHTSRHNASKHHSSHPTQISNADRIARLRSGGPHISPRPSNVPSSRVSRADLPRGRKKDEGYRSSGKRGGTQPKPMPSKPVQKVESRGAKKRHREPSEAPLHTVTDLKGCVHSIALSGDGRFAVTANQERKIHLWDTASWFLLHTIPVDSPISCVAWGPIEDIVAFGTLSGEVQVWKMLSTQRLFVFKHPAPVLSMDWSPDGKTLWTGDQDGSVVLWELESGSSQLSLPTRQSGIHSLALDSSGQMLATAAQDRWIKIWNTEQGALRAEFAAPLDDSITCFQFAPKRLVLLSGSRKHNVSLWDAQSNTLQMTLQKHEAAITAVSFAPDDSWFVSGGEDSKILLWSAATGKLLKSYTGHTASIRALCVSPKGDWLVAADDACTMKVWSTLPQK